MGLACFGRLLEGETLERPHLRRPLEVQTLQCFQGPDCKGGPEALYPRRKEGDPPSKKPSSQNRGRRAHSIGDLQWAISVIFTSTTLTLTTSV